MLSDEWLSRYVKFQKLEHKSLTQCDTNVDANVDDRSDYNSSSFLSYRRAKNGTLGLYGLTTYMYKHIKYSNCIPGFSSDLVFENIL